jgi:hypothetical protein
MNSMPLPSGLSANGRFSRLLAWIVRNVVSLAACPPWAGAAFHSLDRNTRKKNTVNPQAFCPHDRPQVA